MLCIPHPFSVPKTFSAPLSLIVGVNLHMLHTHSPLSPYYTMRFPCVALANKPNTNEIYMQRK